MKSGHPLWRADALIVGTNVPMMQKNERGSVRNAKCIGYYKG
jgi:hypothetical protein